MKQLLQGLGDGKTMVVETPVPSAAGPMLLVETRASVISAGTERMLVDFGRSNLLEKARSQPDKVRQVLNKVRTDGFGPTLEAVRAKLESPIPLGYCQAGVVVEAGPRAGRFTVGERVVTNGPHAEYVRVPHTLAAKIPDGVSFEAAAFTPLAAIGLQGIRLAEPTLGETVVVYGLGLIGLLTVQLLGANGCRVIGIDRNAGRMALAEELGATPVDGGTGDVASRVMALTDGRGADAVLLTLASASDDPIRKAAQMCRKRGRVVLVGVTGLTLNRDDFFKKELNFAVSCSYGPGRYDPSYEEAGVDYPYGYVRWTEQRNFEAVLALMASGQVDPRPLVTHRFTFEDAASAYDLIRGAEPSIGVVLTYRDRGGMAPGNDTRSMVLSPATGVRQDRREVCTIGVIGAGNYAVRTLLPLLAKEKVRMRTIASSGGTSGALAARKFGFEKVTTDVGAVFDDEAIDCVFVLTRHNTHADLAARALRAGKHVFVEKPLALSEGELDLVREAALSSGRQVLVGFNRRFAPLAVEVRECLRGRVQPLSVIATVNAGNIPRDHWVHDPLVGGGRVVGEACHWMDLARSFAGSAIADVRVMSARDGQGRPVDDITHICLAFADGSTAVVHYLASGSSAFPKERIECFFEGKSVAIENWRRLKRYGIPGPFFSRPQAMDKGHGAEVHDWIESILRGGLSPIALEEILEVSRWSIHAAERARGSLT